MAFDLKDRGAWVERRVERKQIPDQWGMLPLAECVNAICPLFGLNDGDAQCSRGGGNGLARVVRLSLRRVLPSPLVVLRRQEGRRAVICRPLDAGCGVDSRVSPACKPERSRPGIPAAGG